MNILRTLENQREISRTVRCFCDSFSWETQSVKVWWNLNLLEKYIKEKIIQWWFTSLSLIFLKLNNVSKLSFNHHLFVVFRNSNWFCRWVVLAKISCICLWVFSSSWRTRLHSAFILFHFIIEKVRLHLRLRCTYSMQRSNSLLTRHFFCKWLQCS